MYPVANVLSIARLASTGRVALVYALQLHRLLNLASASITAAAHSDADASHIRDVLGSASDLTRQLLTAGKRPAHDLATIDLGELVDRMREIIGMLAGSEAIVVVVRDAVRVRTRANHGDLEQLLINLIDGPIGTNLGRRITIASGLLEWQGGTTTSGELAAGTYATLTVTDDQRTQSTPIPGTCDACGATPAIGIAFACALAVSCGGALDVAPTADGVLEHRVLLPVAA